MEVKKIKFHPKQEKAFYFNTQFGACIAGVQCLAEDEFVYTPEGIKEVKDITNGDRILGGIVRDNYGYTDDIFEITFNNGIKIKANKEHPFYCKTYRNKKREWLKLQDILDLPKRKGITTARVYFYSSKDIKEVKGINIKSSKLLGYLCSDGSFTHNQSVKFTNIRPEFIREVKELSQEFNSLIKPKPYRKGKGWDLLLTTGHKGLRNPLKRYIESLNITNDSFGKILKAKKEDLIEFVKGYFNGDGYLSLYQNRGKRQDTSVIGFCIGISRNQAYEYQYLLWRIGIKSHIREEEFEKSTRKFYRVLVDRNSNEKLLCLLDWTKYPDKFCRASLIKTHNFRNHNNWITIKSIKRVGKGSVIGWRTEGSNEIISYCGMKTHNSGKTFVGTFWAQKKIQEFPKGDGLIAAPTHPILRQSTLQKFFQIFPEYRRYYKEQKGIIELPTGGTVFIRSTDNPYGIEGMTLDWAWLDEAGQMKSLVWTVIRSRVSVTQGQVLITTTPYNMGWLYQEFYLPWKKREDRDLSVFVWKSTDSPYFTKEFAQKERKRLSATEYGRRYEGEFKKAEGLVYREFSTDNIIEPKEVMGETIAGVDWGYKAPAAIIVLRKDKDLNYYVIDEHYQDKQTTPEILERAKNLQAKHSIRAFYPDPAEPDRIEEMRRAKLAVREVNKDIKGGIDKVRSLIRRTQLFVFRGCINTIDEFETYSYPDTKEGDLPDEKPLEGNDHALDALRYALYTQDPTRGNEKQYQPLSDYIFEKRMKDKEKKDRRKFSMRGY